MGFQISFQIILNNYLGQNEDRTWSLNEWISTHKKNQEKNGKLQPKNNRLHWWVPLLTSSQETSNMNTRLMMEDSWPGWQGGSSNAQIRLLAVWWHCLGAHSHGPKATYGSLTSFQNSPSCLLWKINLIWKTLPAGKHRGIGFVEFELVQDADDAIENLHNSELFGVVIKVSMARQTGMKVQVSNPNVAIWNDEEYLRNKAEYEATVSEQQGEAVEGDEPQDMEKEQPMAKKSKFLAPEAAPASQQQNPVVYFDINIGGTRAGRIVFLLRADIVPSRFISGNFWTFLNTIFFYINNLTWNSLIQERSRILSRYAHMKRGLDSKSPNFIVLSLGLCARWPPSLLSRYSKAKKCSLRSKIGRRFY